MNILSHLLLEMHTKSLNRKKLVGERELGGKGVSITTSSSGSLCWSGAAVREW